MELASSMCGLGVDRLGVGGLGLEPQFTHVDTLFPLLDRPLEPFLFDFFDLRGPLLLGRLFLVRGLVPSASGSQEGSTASVTTSATPPLLSGVGWVGATLEMTVGIELPILPREEGLG